MVCVYALSSINFNYIYVGMTIDINARMLRHNGRREKTTRYYAPFELIYTESCIDRIEARNREKYWKSGIGKEKLREIRDNIEN